MPLEIRFGYPYPSGDLSNLASHSFTIDGVLCGSMEGFLQSLKFKDPTEQREVCALTGLVAKKRGHNVKWQTNQTLYWQGHPIQRSSIGYQRLLDRAYAQLSTTHTFLTALMDSGDEELRHTMGNPNKFETILTPDEFCTRLMKIRNYYQKRFNNQ